MKNYFRLYKKAFSQESIDKNISGGIKGQVILLVLSIVSVLIIASAVVVVFHISLGRNDDWGEQLWMVYNNFVDPGNQAEQVGWSNRLTVICISMFGAVLLNGVLISTISNIIERRVETVRTGKATYKKLKDHYVIIGFSDVTANLIRELHKESDAPIVLMSSTESDDIRDQLLAQLNREEENQVKIYLGNIESTEELKRLNIDQAKEVYILGEEGDYGRNSKNIKCVQHVSTLRGDNTDSRLLPVYVQFDNVMSYSTIQKLELKEYCNYHGKQNIFFRPFNFHENWARRIWGTSLSESDIKKYAPLDYRPICNTDDKHYVHLVIVGLNQCGCALLLEALRVCHYANYDDQMPSDKRIRTVITIIDKELDDKINLFRYQLPYIEKQIDDIKINYRSDDFCSEPSLSDIETWNADPQQMLTIAICLSNTDLSLQLGLNLPPSIYQGDTQILIRQEIQTDLGKLICLDNVRYRNVKTFGMLEQGISKPMLQDNMASFINQEYCENGYLLNLYRMYTEGDANFAEEKRKAQSSWQQMEENMRWANRYQIDAYSTYLRTLGYRITFSPEQAVTDPEFLKNLPEEAMRTLMRMEKNRWNAERSIEGWRYEPTRDNIHRTHPLICPFGQLPPKEQTKDKSVIENLYYVITLGGYHIEKC